MGIIEKAPKWSFLDLLEKSNNLFSEQNFMEQYVYPINEAYLYWDKVKYKPLPKGVTSEQYWASVKLSRVIDYKKLIFGNYTFNLKSTDYIQKMLHWLDFRYGGGLESENPIPDNEKKRYLIGSIMEEAIASSKMEGASTTRRHAKEILRKQLTPKDKSEIMIVNNYKTISHITENKNAELTPQSLLEIHRLISCNTLDNKEDEGSFRASDDVNVVDVMQGEIVHTPPKADEIPQLIDDLCRFFNTDDEKSFVHPVVKGIIIHFMIGYIHPFVDGNGRTARALFYWYLLKEGYWLTEYLSISRIIKDKKKAYEKAYLYVENDDNDLTYFVVYNVGVMQDAFQALLDYIQRKSHRKNNGNQYLHISNVNERQAEILQWLVEDPPIVLSVMEIERRIGVANQTARTDLLGLVELGLLKIIEPNKKKRHYVRTNDFDEKLKGYMKHT